MQFLGSRELTVVQEQHGAIRGRAGYSSLRSVVQVAVLTLNFEKTLLRRIAKVKEGLQRNNPKLGCC